MKEIRLRKFFKEAVKQGPEHQENIECVFKLLREAVEAEFVEDNAPTLDALMLELFEKSQSNCYKNKKCQIRIFNERLYWR